MNKGSVRIIALLILFCFSLNFLLPANMARAIEIGQEEEGTFFDDSEQVAEYDDGKVYDINEVEPFIEPFSLMTFGSTDEKFDIVFLLDRSGSMAWNDPNNYRIQGTIEWMNSKKTIICMRIRSIPLPEPMLLLCLSSK